jgi:hypothetical protein
MQRRVSQIFSVVAVIGFVFWLYAEPSYEPALGLLVSIGAVIHQLWPQKSKQDYTLLKNEFFAINARWNAEKELRSPNIDDAKWLLSELLEYLQAVRVEISKPDIHADIDRLFLKVKNVQSTRIYIDGGVSSQKFWKDGSDSIKEVALLIEKIYK